MAAGQAARPEPAASKPAVPRDGITRVIGAHGLEPATVAEKGPYRRHVPPVEVLDYAFPNSLALFSRHSWSPWRSRRMACCSEIHCGEALRTSRASLRFSGRAVLRVGR